MNQIIVYQTNYSGLFVGESLADESPLEFNNETAGVIRLTFQHSFHQYRLTDDPLFVTHHVIEELNPTHRQQSYRSIQH